MRPCLLRPSSGPLDPPPAAHPSPPPTQPTHLHTSSGGATVEYKYVVCSVSDLSQAVRWKEGGNFSLRVPAQGGRLRVRDSWDESQREVEVSAASEQESKRAASGLACMCAWV